MTHSKSARSNLTAGHGPELARLARASSSFRELRHLGFRTLVLPAGRELGSEGPSPFHELGYCVDGEVLLHVWQGPNTVDSFAARAGDFFFIPAGASYTLGAAEDRPSRLIIATARDGVDVDNFPLGEGGRVLVEDAGPSGAQRKPNGRFRKTRDDHHVDFSVDDGHVVLFFDHRAERDASRKSVANVFDKGVLVREFGIAESALPDLEFGYADPVVIRPIVGESFIARSLD